MDLAYTGTEKVAVPKRNKSPLNAAKCNRYLNSIAMKASDTSTGDSRGITETDRAISISGDVCLDAAESNLTLKALSSALCAKVIQDKRAALVVIY